MPTASITIKTDRSYPYSISTPISPEGFSTIRSKLGTDYYVTPKQPSGSCSAGRSFTAKGNSDAIATWMDASQHVDSAIATNSSSDNHFRNGMVNLNLRHSISSKQDLGVDIDWLNYAISSEQYFNNRFQSPGGYNEASQGDIPSSIKILSGKIDYNLRFGKNNSFQAGWKSSHISTDNTAAYENFDGLNWTPDYNKSNHFLYKENIHALYSSIETRRKKYPCNWVSGTSSRVTMPTSLATCSKRFGLLA